MSEYERILHTELSRRLCGNPFHCPGDACSLCGPYRKILLALEPLIPQLVKAAIEDEQKR